MNCSSVDDLSPQKLFSVEPVRYTRSRWNFGSACEAIESALVPLELALGELQSSGGGEHTKQR